MSRLVPFSIGCLFVAAAWYVGTHGQPWWAVAALAFCAGEFVEISRGGSS